MYLVFTIKARTRLESFYGLSFFSSCPALSSFPKLSRGSIVSDL